MTNVLVLCTGNSARSILLEVILRVKGEGRVRAFSAGSQPAGKVNPGAVACLERKGLPTSGLRSKSWDEFAEPGAPAMGAIITVCSSAAEEVCPIWPGVPVRAHWGVEDPAAVTGPAEAITAAFEDAYTILNRRAEAFLALPFETLETRAMNTELTRIGSL